MALAAATLALALPPCRAQPAAEDAEPPQEGRQIALLPLLNRTGAPAPLDEIRRELGAALVERGLLLLDDAELDRFMRRHRMRWTGGVNQEIARLLRSETGAAGALVTSLDLYQESGPPKIGLTSRLVSSGNVPRILWMDARAVSGDESPGFLGLRLVAEQTVVRRRVLAGLAGSLASAAEPLAHQAAGFEARLPRSPRRFRPKIAYSAPGSDIRQAAAGRIVVLPLANESTTRYAGEIVTDQLVRHLFAAGANVVEPGVVRHAMLEARQIQPQGPSVPQVDIVRAALTADLVFYGEVAAYVDAGGGTPEPLLGFSLRAVDTATRQVIWASVSHTRGGDGVVFFDVGRVATAHRLASEMTRAIVAAVGSEVPARRPDRLAADRGSELERATLLAIVAGRPRTPPPAGARGDSVSVAANTEVPSDPSQ